MSRAIITEQYLTDIANAIRTKTGETISYTPPEMANKILTIHPVLQNKSYIPTETSAQIIADNGYDGLGTVTVSGITPTYVGTGVTRKSAETFTPSTANQTIAANQYLTGAQTIAGDADLIASNIKHDTNIFGVTGTFRTRIEYVTLTTSSNSTSITFTGLKAQPMAFFYNTMGNITMNRSYRNLTSVSYDGNIVGAHTYYLIGGNSGTGGYFTTCTYSYNNGSLTINSASASTSGYFYAGQHILIYVYEE